MIANDFQQKYIRGMLRTSQYKLPNRRPDDTFLHFHTWKEVTVTVVHRAAHNIFHRVGFTAPYRYVPRWENRFGVPTSTPQREH